MKALLVVDIQKGLTKRKGFYNTDLFFRTVNSAIEQYCSKGFPVIYIQHNNKMLVPSTTDWKIDDRVRMCANGVILHKKHANAFTNTNLDGILASKDVNEILVCGLSNPVLRKGNLPGRGEERPQRIDS